MRPEDIMIMGLCFMGFAILGWDQLSKFLSQQKLNLFTYERVTEESLFVMVFCPKIMYKRQRGRPRNIFNDSVMYDMFVNQAKVTFDALTFQRDKLTDYDPPLELHLKTKYNGICKVFDFGRRKYKLNTFATFEMSIAQGPLTLFILRAGKEILSLGSLDFYQHPPVLEIDTTSLILMGARYHKTLHLEDHPCQENPKYDFQDFFECVNDELNKFAVESDLKCAPLYLWPFLKSLEGKSCPSPREDREIYFRTSEIIFSQMNGGKSVCIRPCKVPVLEAKSIPFGVDHASKLIM